jgi:hypothetical protein
MQKDTKLELSKETLRSLNTRPLTAEEVQQVGGAWDDGTFTYCAGSTGCSTHWHCPER